MFKSVGKNRSFTEGPLFSKIFLFALPIMLTGILQVLYNLADHIVVGQFSGDPLALAAVGSTTSLTALVVNMLVGISAGTSVVVAQSYGAKDYGTLSRALHSSIAFAAIGGLAFCGIGLLVSRPALILMGTKPELLDSSTLYMRIICMGIPASAVMNFGAATLRASGDSKTPMIIFTSSGVINVILNLIFVILCHMTVDGVALATIISQYISACCIVGILIHRKSEPYAFSFKKLKIHKRELLMVLRYGVPAALQTIMYSISNIAITSAANVFSTVDLSAKTITTNIDSILYTSLNSYQHAAMTVSAQNYGAGKYKRISRSLGYTLIQVIVVGIGLGTILRIFADPVMSMFIDASDPNRAAIMERGRELLTLLLSTYFLLGIMETLSGTLRGLSYSVSPMLISIMGICGVRILWILLVFPLESVHSMIGLYAVYPVSWIITTVAFAIFCIFAWKKLGRMAKASEDSQSKSKDNEVSPA